MAISRYQKLINEYLLWQTTQRSVERLSPKYDYKKIKKLDLF